MAPQPKARPAIDDIQFAGPVRMTEGAIAASPRLAFTVYGLPAPKGSTRAFVVRKHGVLGKGRAVVVPDNKGPARLWAGVIAHAASRAVAEQLGGEPIHGAVRVEVTFHLPRPKSLPRRVERHTKKPDCDKLARNVGDALRRIAYDDDACVVEWLARKCYAAPGQAPHATIEVTPA